jgi:hypothetical protein
VTALCSEGHAVHAIALDNLSVPANVTAKSRAEIKQSASQHQGG